MGDVRTSVNILPTKSIDVYVRPQAMYQAQMIIIYVSVSIYRHHSSVSQENEDSGHGTLSFLTTHF